MYTFKIGNIIKKVKVVFSRARRVRMRLKTSYAFASKRGTKQGDRDSLKLG